MFENVIVGVDERESRADAIRLARELVGPRGTVTLARVHGSYPVFGEGLSGGYEQELREKAQALLDRVSAETGIRSTVTHAANSVGRGLHELAEQRGADLLVIGSTHRGLVDRVLVGNDTTDAINGSRCAVAIAPAAYAAKEGVIHKVGVGYNASPEAEAAVTAGRELAASHHAELSLFEAVAYPIYAHYGIYGYAVPYDNYITDLVGYAKAQLAKVDADEREVELGDPAEELAQFSGSVDLLIVGSRGFGPLGRLVHSSTSKRLSRRARCPLLILPRAVETADPNAATGAQVEDDRS